MIQVERSRMPAGCFAALVGAALVLGTALVPAPARSQQPDPAETRRIMHEVFGALQRVLPPSLDEQRFADPARRKEIQAALQTLASNADRLAAHAAGSEPGFEFLSSSLALGAHEIERRYAAGQFREARFELHEFTENCVACHSRLPDERDADLSSRFMQESEIAALPLPEQAQLAMATRQFERALAAQETMLTSPKFDVTSIDLLGYLDDYLEVTVRVKGDFERAARTLETFSKRSQVRTQLRHDVERWVVDLRELAKRGRIDGFEAGRRMTREAEAAAAEDGRRPLTVRYQAASGALQRFVAAAPRSDPHIAEAYYWLGVIESRVGRSYLLSQTEPYLEAAIRLAPGQPIAKQAYTLLEDYVVGGYTGSSGEHVPPDVQTWLAELKRLAMKAS